MRILRKHPKSFIQKPGEIAMIPGWVWLYILLIALLLLFPNLLPKNNTHPINVYLLALIVGSIIPLFDDVLTFLFGPPFAHHSLFHSIFSLLITFPISIILFSYSVGMYVVYGHVFHIFFNFVLDYLTLFFPFSKKQYGLTSLVKISTYKLKSVSYPLILLGFFVSVIYYIRVYS